MESITEPHDCSNVIIAAFVTAQGRIKLYSVSLPLDKLLLFLIQTPSSIFKDLNFGIQPLSTIDWRNELMKYLRVKPCRLWVWDQIFWGMKSLTKRKRPSFSK